MTKSLTETIQQIGGRERLEELASFKPSGSNSVNSASREEWMAMARALVAVLDAQPVAWVSERNLKVLGKSFSVFVKHEPVMVRPVPLYTVPPAPGGE